ncbi:MAG: alpha/beta hydrolase [Phenylobacterium sp.]
MCLGLAGQAAASPVSAEVAPKIVSTDSYPARKTPFAGGVTGLADITYSILPGYRPLKLDLYRPAGAGAKPLVIYIHGGGWTGGTARNAGAFANFPAVLADLASRGYVVASLNYRLSGEAPFPAAAEDVDAAIRWLKAHAGEYGIDKSRVAVWGGSAGGQLAALAATDCHPGEAAAESDCVQGSVIWYGVFDFATMPPQRARDGSTAEVRHAYLDCLPSNCAGPMAAASAMGHVDATDPPMLLIHGVLDKTVPVAQSRAMAAKLQGAGVKSQLIEIEGADHSWIAATPEATRAASLQALQATFDFFDATLKP